MIAVLARTERSNGMNSVLRRMVFSPLLAHHHRNCRSETEPGRGPTVVLSEKSQISGPLGKAGSTLVLDTGATSTSLNVSLLRSVGYDPDAATDFARLTTGTTATMVPRLMLNRLSALRRHVIG